MASHSLFETSVRAALGDLELAVAAGRPPAPNPALRPALARLEEFTAALPPDLDPQLRHYLQKRSYEKARVWLDGGESEAGPCPR